MSDLPIDLDKVRAFLDGKRERTRRARTALLEQAQSDARAIIERIAQAHNPQRIYQWGSLVETGHFTELSDIDIALEGLRSVEEFFAILGEVMGMTTFPLDIIELEKVDTETAEGIRRQGRIVHEGKGDR
jgi:predicted nucleotidyltransferase